MWMNDGWDHGTTTQFSVWISKGKRLPITPGDVSGCYRIDLRVCERVCGLWVKWKREHETVWVYELYCIGYSAAIILCHVNKLIIWKEHPLTTLSLSLQLCCFISFIFSSPAALVISPIINCSSLFFSLLQHKECKALSREGGDHVERGRRKKLRRSERENAPVRDQSCGGCETEGEIKQRGSWWRLKDPSFHQSLPVNAAYRCNQRRRERHLTFSPHLSSPQPLERKRRGVGLYFILPSLLFLSIAPSLILHIWYADDRLAIQMDKLQAARKRYLALSDLQEGPHSNAVLRLP